MILGDNYGINISMLLINWYFNANKKIAIFRWLLYMNKWITIMPL